MSKRTLLPSLSSYTYTVYFLFGTAAEIPIEKRLVKVESEADLDQDSGAIGTMEFLQKGKHTEETQDFVDRTYAFSCQSLGSTLLRNFLDCFESI